MAVGAPSYKGFRFPAEIISHCVWLYYRFSLSFREIEEMMLAPEEHKWVRVRNEDIGEKGCKQWHVLPRFGPLGLLMNWWRVKISSGCPLAGGRGLGPRPGEFL